MEIDSSSQEKMMFFTLVYVWIGSMIMKFNAKVISIAKEAKKMGKDDPRKIIHSAKVGLALTFVSCYYYITPIYDGIGQAGMWAIITVVVVLEFSVGATISKSINRGFATLFAGALGVGAVYLAKLTGKIGEPIMLGFFVFILATAATFTRFFPKVKRRHDYGIMVFILTFCLVAVSGCRVEEIFELAHQRLSTILVGVATCMVISISICPVWAGEDLHNLIASNIEKLGSFLEGLSGEYFNSHDGEIVIDVTKKDKSFLRAYKSVLNTKASEELMENFAWWEPRHGRFAFRHPWKQYLKIGALTRECACQFEALSVYINSKHEAPSEFQMIIQESCTRMSSESGKALKELASAIKNMTHPLNFKTHIQNATTEINDFKEIFESTLLENVSLNKIIPVITVVSILIETINCIEKLSEAINEFSNLSHFKDVISSKSTVKPVNDIESDDHVAIEVRGSSEDSPATEDFQASKKSQQVGV